MKKLLISLSLLLFLSACEPSGPRTPTRAPEDVSFRTTPPSRLYFLNIRSTNYEQTTQPGTRIDRYRLRRFDRTTRRPLLYPVIVDNWMADEAYVLIQPNDFQDGYSDTLRVFWRGDRDSGRYELALANWPGQYAFAEQLLHSLEQEHTLEIQTAAGARAELFSDKADRLNFATTMRDYYKLIERD